MVLEEVQHDMVKARGVAMQIHSMTHVRLDVRFERTCVRESLLRLGRNGRKRGCRSSEAVSTAVDFIFV